MQTFATYILNREHNSDVEQPNLEKLLRMAWERYQVETDEFFKELSQRDPDIKNEFRKLRATANLSPKHHPVDMHQDRDEIVPSTADHGMSGEEQE